MVLATLCLIAATVTGSGVLSGVLIVLGLALGLGAVAASWRLLQARPPEGVHHPDDPGLRGRNRG